MSFTISLERDIQTIRKAFDDKKLQCFDVNATDASYLGPCAIGILLPMDVAKEADKNGGQVTILWLKGIISCYPEEISDLSNLQVTHDRAVFGKSKGSVSSYDIIKLNREIKYLEKKYKKSRVRRLAEVVANSR